VPKWSFRRPRIEKTGSALKRPLVVRRHERSRLLSTITIQNARGKLTESILNAFQSNCNLEMSHRTNSPGTQEYHPGLTDSYRRLFDLYDRSPAISASPLRRLGASTLRFSPRTLAIATSLILINCNIESAALDFHGLDCGYRGRSTTVG
jgi:hypothetical protein